MRHHECGTPPRFAYTIALERVRSWTGLLHWWTHLSRKEFLAATDWISLVERTLEPAGRPSADCCPPSRGI
ncbi:hypothetical protein [Streptomyces sp. N35]|uniref:hypothetical protein n=1 Tax=Streptomyces sp. N35 TaxID=2795730 RepID=UPI0018F6F097|nr:hypothetical protein [Streptomyces sp. N35]